MCLHQASRAASAVFHCQLFWKTRFYLGGDRGFLNYLLADLSDGDKPLRWDWRLAYHQTKRERMHKKTTHRFRRAVWQQCEWLKDRYMTTRARDLGQLSAKDEQLADTLSWVDIRDEAPFNQCNEILYPSADGFEQILLINDSVCRIGVSVVEEHIGMWKTIQPLSLGLSLSIRSEINQTRYSATAYQGSKYTLIWGLGEISEDLSIQGAGKAFMLYDSALIKHRTGQAHPSQTKQSGKDWFQPEK